MVSAFSASFRPDACFGYLMIIRALSVIGIGALAMYFFDPVSGRRRRALLRDQLVHAQKEIGGYAEGTAKDLRNRAHGLAAEARKRLNRTQPPA
jgi:hypothetical protein